MGSTSHELRDMWRGTGFYTSDLQNQQAGPTVTGSIFTDTNNQWGNGTKNDRQTVAVDAHYGMQVTYDYFLQVHNRNGIDGSGHSGFSRVHYGTWYNNAFWSDMCFGMTYGDGDGGNFNLFTALDVAGHAMAHGVTSRTANLFFGGELGGLNEATSDIFGALVEFHANSPNDPGDYLIGEKIFTPAPPGDALRYMHHPSLDGMSPGCYSGTIGGLDVHYSSGVANHFFYLLAEGSSGNPASPT